MGDVTLDRFVTDTTNHKIRDLTPCQEPSTVPPSILVPINLPSF